MASTFEIIAEEFIDDMEAIRSLVVTFSDPAKSGKARIAAANSATLLVAATFEEFVREMAREHARAVVMNTASFDKLPSKLAATAWKRTMDGLSKVRFDDVAGTGGESVFGAAQARFKVIYEFCKGDLTQDIYRELIHNENNMRPNELNGLFKVSGLGDVCQKLSDKPSMLDIFGETEPGKAHGKLLAGLEDFFERRNAIAHALNPGQSSGPDQIINDIDMLESFGKALHETLDALVPKSSIAPTELVAAAIAPV
ncbi:HEPN domain-containing protein [Paraburkholderia azotifigens]|uniref:HEPN domain-containing protein n=1 Tax=Paraburkholderia azotifigens TaxID=2057004 RepID=UPI003170DBC4